MNATVSEPRRLSKGVGVRETLTGDIRNYSSVRVKIQRKTVFQLCGFCICIGMFIGILAAWYVTKGIIQAVEAEKKADIYSMQIKMNEAEAKHIIALATKDEELMERENTITAREQEVVLILKDAEAKYAEAETVAIYTAILEQENIGLQNTIKKLAAKGIYPQNYQFAPEVETIGYTSSEYVGKFSLTGYTPSVIECGNDLGITASGRSIIPGYIVAADTDYWPFGTEFYVSGIGRVIVGDTGTGVDGSRRLDLAAFSVEFARTVTGSHDVYLIKRGDGRLSKEDVATIS